MNRKRGRPSKTPDSMSPQRQWAKLDTSQDEDLIVRLLKFMIEESSNASCFGEFAARYQEGWDFYHGRQWLDENGDEIDPDPDSAYLNFDVCFQQVRRINPLLTDARPVRYIRADHPNRLYEKLVEFQLRTGVQQTIRTDQQIAEDLTEKWRAIEDRSMEEMKYAQRLLNMTVGGMAWAFPYWHSPYPGSPGELRIRTVKDSRSVRVDPNSEEADYSDARYMVIKKFYDADRLQREFRLSDAVMAEIIGAASYEPSEFDRLAADTTNNPLGSSTDKRPSTITRPRVIVWEVWFWPQLPAERREEGLSNVVEHLFGRVFLLAGEKLIANPMPNPYRHGEFPGVAYRDNPDPTSPYGFGEIHWLKQPQLALNLLANLLLQNAAMTGNNRIVTEDGVFKSQPTNTPGEVLITEPGKFDRWTQLKGAEIPTSLLGLVQMFQAKANERVNETIQGLPPGAQSSGNAISSLQDAALSIIREKARLIEWAYQRQGRLEVSLIQQFGSAGMWEEWQSLGKFDYGEWEEWDERIRTLQYDIAIESKAELPMNILDRMKVALQQRQLGLIDELETLEFMKFPISKRQREELELANQAQRATLEFQMMQLEMAKMQLRAQMFQMQGMMQQATSGVAGTGQEAIVSRGQLPAGTEEEVAVSYPAQSDLVAQEVV